MKGSKLSPNNPPNEAWIAASAACLNAQGSWTGRIHLHKHLYITKALKLASPPFEFVLYQYGPYSYELDSLVAQMELYGQIVKHFPSPGYGPRYLVSSLGAEEAAGLTLEDRDALERVAVGLGDSDSQTLELQATCLWVEQEERISEDDALIKRVKLLKPKYDEARIARELEAIRVLARTLRGGLQPTSTSSSR